ncbi:DNA mismatch repair protein MutS, partial [Candidatus Microgenomates bacterium]|nr:DNA mismatch repair protein MutS [Candidatus Microgenomates bacterium]
MHEFSTPMMRQYHEIKKKYPGCLLFYRMGDFYELFLEDAHIGARVLNITLTGKAGGKDGRIPMAGIPYHAMDSYLAKLVKAGYKVAICEQLSPPNKKGLVERDVIRIVTPGTLLDENALEKKTNNYIVSILIKGSQASLAVADLSTGYFAVSEKQGDHQQWLLDELARIGASECILPDVLYNNHEFLKLLKSQQDMNIYSLPRWNEYTEAPDRLLREHFGVKTLAAFGIEHKPLSLQTTAALLGYLQETQKTTVNHIKTIVAYETDAAMVLDKSTTLNLELFSTIREHNTQGSLLSVLDETVTSMGGRLLKMWLKKPLVDDKQIATRHEGVAVFLKEHKKRKEVRASLEEVADIERILSRLSVNIGNARDLVNMQLSLSKILKIKEYIYHEEGLASELCKMVAEHIPSALQQAIQLVTHYLVPEPPIDPKNGGLIVKGVNKELDKLRDIIGSSKQWMESLEITEREATGINTLKIRYNRVFGFYIEISKSNLHLVPQTYTRKQTLVNGERFVTEDLKKHEEIILTAQEKANEIEYELFVKVLTEVLEFTSEIQQAAQAIATLDCIATFAHVSQKYGYVRPVLLNNGEIHITQGRHAVVERLLDNESQFVPNDVSLDTAGEHLLLITGPNMAGKSVFIRQVALIVLMNQIGCFVPVKKAQLSIVDRIFVRSGASDMITSGLSTFMVEMVETAHILNNATEKSLIVMDEIGRGTSTYDGISIAWAVAQYLVTHFSPSPKTLFATHYHELQLLEKEYPNAIKNFHMAVGGDKSTPVFLHTLLAGGASHSFGIVVAQLAGLPSEVIDSAKSMLQSLEKR